MTYLLIPVLSVLLTLIPCSWSQCTPYRLVQQWRLNPAPVEYDSGGVTSIPCPESPPGFICARGSLPIDDGEYGPDNLTDLSAVYAWNQDVSITFGMNVVQETRVTGINLFFYNIPSIGIGLPHEIELNWGNSPTLANNRLGHVVLGNQDLSEDDYILRNVTIVALATVETDEVDYLSINITFRFSDANNIRWLLLSEIEICNDPSVLTIPTVTPIPMAIEGPTLIQLGLNDIQSELNITCTVATEGSFQWQWTSPTMGVVASFANANRTSMYTLTQISSDSVGNVVCQAAYTTAPTSSTGSRTFILQFAPPVLEAFNTTVRAQTNSSVILSCELYGYLSNGTEPHISWQKLPNTAITSSDPLYMISSTNGTKQIQNGGSTPGPSFVSSLTIDMVDETVAGTYLCSSSTGTTTPSITLTVTAKGPPANAEIPTSNTALAADGRDSILAVIGGIVGGLAVTVLVVIAVVVIAVVLCRRQTDSENTYDLPADYKRPIPPHVDSLPPRLEVNLAYEQVKSFDMTDNSAYSV